MKTFWIVIFGLLNSTNVFAAGKIEGNPIEMIVCQATVHYEEETPTEKTPANEIYIFRAGSRPDVRPKPGAFLETVYTLDEKGSLQERGDSQYYFTDAVNGKIHFAFIADWKSSGELSWSGTFDGTAQGYINSKGHVTELSCSIRTAKSKTRVR
jgi:hypothetical protein